MSWFAKKKLVSIGIAPEYDDRESAGVDADGFLEKKSVSLQPVLAYFVHFAGCRRIGVHPAALARVPASRRRFGDWNLHVD